MDTLPEQTIILTSTIISSIIKNIYSSISTNHTTYHTIKTKKTHETSPNPIMMIKTTRFNTSIFTKIKKKLAIPTTIEETVKNTSIIPTYMTGLFHIHSIRNSMKLQQRKSSSTPIIIATTTIITTYLPILTTESTGY